MSSAKGVVEKGDKIAIDYIGRFTDGKVFDTSIDSVAKESKIFNSGRWYEPLEFVVGSGKVIKGFDDAVLGLRPGQSKVVTIPPEQAYGKTGNHPLAGKTLVFELKLIKIK